MREAIFLLCYLSSYALNAVAAVYGFHLLMNIWFARIEVELPLWATLPVGGLIIFGLLGSYAKTGFLGDVVYLYILVLLALAPLAFLAWGAPLLVALGLSVLPLILNVIMGWVE